MFRIQECPLYRRMNAAGILWSSSLIFKTFLRYARLIAPYSQLESKQRDYVTTAMSPLLGDRKPPRNRGIKGRVFMPDNSGHLE